LGDKLANYEKTNLFLFLFACWFFGADLLLLKILANGYFVNPSTPA